MSPDYLIDDDDFELIEGLTFNHYTECEEKWAASSNDDEAAEISRWCHADWDRVMAELQRRTGLPMKVIEYYA